MQNFNDRSKLNESPGPKKSGPPNDGENLTSPGPGAQGNTADSSILNISTLDIDSTDTTTM